MVAKLITRHRVSERRACRVVGQPRATQRYCPKLRDRDTALRRRLVELAGEHPRYGYRRMTVLLRGEGWAVNPKRIYRLWRAEGLRVPQRRREWRAPGEAKNGCHAQPAKAPNDVWAYDFLSDQTTDGRTLRVFAVVDEFTRRALALVPARRFPGTKVVDVLADLVHCHGAPRAIRSDNGPELVSKAVRGYLESLDIGALFVAPGAPWQNGYAETFNARFRDELLDRELLGSLVEARVVLEAYRREYNDDRPHSTLGYLTPNEYTRRIWESAQANNPNPPGLA